MALEQNHAPAAATTTAAAAAAAAATVENEDGEESSRQRKRQRIEPKDNDGQNEQTDNDSNDDDDDARCSSKIHYQGWEVPEFQYKIPILTCSDKDNLPTPRQFYDAYVRRRRPVVLRGALFGQTEWSHLESWHRSNQDLLRAASSQTIQVERRSSVEDSFGKGEEVSMTVGEFLHTMQQGDTLHYLTTQDVRANADGRPDLMSPLMQQLRKGIGGETSSSDNDATPRFPLRPTLAGNLVPQNINLWMGNTSTKAPSSSGLHHDYHDNFYLVVRGTKRFRLFAPSEVPKMYTRGTLAKVHPNGRINYQGELTTAYGADMASDAAAQASKAKEFAEEELQKAEQALAEGNPGAEQALAKAEALLDAAMEAILDAETRDDNDDDDEEEAFCLETAREEDVQGMLELEPLSSDEDEEEEEQQEGTREDEFRLVDKTVKNPNNFSRIDPSLLDDPQRLRTDFPKFLQAKSAVCECHAGDILYLPASWFHEVSSSSSAKSTATKSPGNDSPPADAGNTAETTMGHLALNYWFHPPDAENDFENPYTTDFWPNDYRNRFLDTCEQPTK